MPSIVHTLSISGGAIRLNEQLLYQTHNAAPVADVVYRHFAMSYPKFFKMDVLCKWAFIAAELLTRSREGYVYDAYDKTEIALVLATHTGCLSADRRYQQTRETLPSPAIFVYTLPNIMLGELSIRHGFKGEQICLMQESFDKRETLLHVQDLFANRGVKACLCGFIDATEEHVAAELYWVR